MTQSLQFSDAPPLPPRGRKSRLTSSEVNPEPEVYCNVPSMTSSASDWSGVNIQPVVQDGVQQSQTHYWLLPDRGSPKQTAQVRPYNRTPTGSTSQNTVSGDYRNVVGAQSADLTIIDPFASSNTQPQASGFLNQGYMTSLGVVEGAVGNGGGPRGSALSREDENDLLRLNDSPNRLLYSRTPRNNPSLYQLPPSHISNPPLPPFARGAMPQPSPSNQESLGDVRAKIHAIQNQVHGVTNEETLAALQASNFHTESAIKYLKIEQLFRLGIATREKCTELLQKFSWNLEAAGSALLDRFTSGSPV